MSAPELAEVTVHECPPNGSGLMPCCGLPPGERPFDRITLDHDLVTCGAHDHARQVEEFGECLTCVASSMTRPPPARTPVTAAHAPVGANHPDTAHQAATRALPRSGSDREAVLAFIAGRGNEGATDDEIEQTLGLPHQTASARRNGLAGDGWIVDSGRRRATRSGRDAIVWVAHPD